MVGVDDIFEVSMVVLDAADAIRPGAGQAEREILFGIGWCTLVENLLHLGSRIVRQHLIGDRADHPVALKIPGRCIDRIEKAESTNEQSGNAAHELPRSLVAEMAIYL
jgi:hypothetical protein